VFTTVIKSSSLLRCWMPLLIIVVRSQLGSRLSRSFQAIFFKKTILFLLKEICFQIKFSLDQIRFWVGESSGYTMFLSEGICSRCILQVNFRCMYVNYTLLVFYLNEELVYRGCKGYETQCNLIRVRFFDIRKIMIF
jgi:hypothetical protein